MNKLIWKMYNENRISLEVAEELLDLKDGEQSHNGQCKLAGNHKMYQF